MKNTARCLSVLLALILALPGTALAAAGLTPNPYGTDGVPAFVDVSDSDWFASEVQWAVNRGITTGTTDTTFSPEQTCTIAQILTFLHRSAGSPTPIIANPYSDVRESDYFYAPALWAYEHGLVTDTFFDGNRACTRAMTVTYLWRLSGSPSAQHGVFLDVPDNASYADAVYWAYAHNITSGTSDTMFSPEQTCTRAQIVTFLYRYENIASTAGQPVPETPAQQNAQASQNDWDQREDIDERFYRSDREDQAERNAEHGEREAQISSSPQAPQGPVPEEPQMPGR